MRNKFDDDFDRDFNRTRTVVYIFQAIGLIITLGIFGFIGWVIVMIMRFFGVI